jgi:hypothetical protein
MIAWLVLQELVPRNVTCHPGVLSKGSRAVVRVGRSRAGDSTLE